MPRPRSRLSSISYRRDRSSSGSSSDARSYTSVSSLGLSSRDASPTRKISSRPAKTGSTFLAPNAETRSRRNGRRGRLSRQTSPPPFPLNVPPRPSTPPPVLPADDASEPSKSPQETDATIGSSKDSTTIINLPVSAEGVSITRASPSIQGEPGTVIRIDLSGIWGAIATPTPTAAEPSADDSADPVPDPSTQDDTDSTEEPEEPEVVPPEPKIPASDFYPKNPFEPKPSKAAFEWQRQKNLGASNAAIDELMELVGLEEVKEQVLAIQAKVDICRRQGIDLREAKERFNVVFQGNPGTGTPLPDL